ncbi:DUF6970 domain-containing protein [Pseudoxanthomonas sp. 22568]|uniref:DUF6970 domain-containing protein n=1 Tax=Pseudoxanthomonas sp. 22568 TaxID=3453945 RepID=UPI003F82A618
MTSPRRVTRFRITSCFLLSAALAACTHAPADSGANGNTTSAGTTASTGQEPLPDWLRARIADYERLPANGAPGSIWRITHQGSPAFYLVSPCCDQFNPLLDARGKEICSPSGGFTGAGDGKCPKPMDAGTEAIRVWVHPEEEHPPAAAPGLGR